MDAHFFRRLAFELSSSLQGARIERFYAPAPDITTIVLHTTGPKQHVLLRAGRRFPFLLLSPERPPNPETPSAHAMWLRKHAGGRRLGPAVIDWCTRRMAFPLSGATSQWLMLDLRDGVGVLDVLPEGFGREPVWPEPAELLAISEHADAWQTHPQLTPLLRETLALLRQDDPLDACALLSDLEYGPQEGGGEVHVYAMGSEEVLCSAWPLPDAQRRGRDEAVWDTALEAALAAGRPLVFGGFAQRAEQLERAPIAAALKRTRKTLAKLDAEEERLLRMIAQQDDGMALQGALWRIGADTKLDAVDLPDKEGVVKTLHLDPLCTVRENMERFFKQAARGKRGIGMLQERREQVRDQVRRLEQGDTDAVPVRQKRMEPAQGSRNGRSGKGAADTDARLFHRFRSSDGFMMLRGRNAKGNHTILDKAMPHDLWFHAEDGPSAHLVLRRQFPEQDVPQSSLLEAAELVGLRSWQKEGRQARVMYALVRNVRKVKGAAVGAVHVGRMEGSLLVALDAGTEERLAVSLMEE